MCYIFCSQRRLVIILLNVQPLTIIFHILAVGLIIREKRNISPNAMNNTDYRGGEMAYDLGRFKTAQDKDFETALNEIAAGKKRTHWIWYIFPQLKDLGFSDFAVYYGIQDLDEAKAYIEDKMLGGNLIKITEALLEHKGKNIVRIFGRTDAVKVRSCMTLFEKVSDSEVFPEVLEAFYDGERDEKTLELLAK